MRIAAMTHVGLVRPHNEDCVAVSDWIRSRSMASPLLIECAMDEPQLIAIADGLGGHKGGEFASMFCIRELSSKLASLTGLESVITALKDVNEHLYNVMEESPEYIGMGTTVVGLATLGTDIYLFNIGDSRAYELAGSHLRLLSINDSFNYAIANLGIRTELHWSEITQALGGASIFQPIDPHLVSRSAVSGERYLLCSDGLTDMLNLEAIEACLIEDPKGSVDILIQAALAAGGLDNISVLIVDII